MKNLFPSTIAALGLAVFTISTATGQAQFSYVTNDSGTITITGYTGPGGDVTIPGTINGLSVTSIGSGAFACSSLTSIAIPNSVTTIGGSAFSMCYRLSSITIPNSVTTIGDSAFSECCSLSSITIPNSVTSIGNRPFDGCTSLTAIAVEPLNLAYSSLDGTLFNKHQTTLIRCPPTRAGKYAIPNSVTSIGEFAFGDCATLTSITISNSVTSIGDGAFYNCTALMGVYFNGNAPDFGPWVFVGDSDSVVYYLPGTSGWGLTVGDRPTAPWVLPAPVILTTTPNFGVQSNAFGFRISWATNRPVVVEASTTLANPNWSPVSRNTLSNGWSDFRDSQWKQSPARFYRIRSQ